MFWVCSQCSLTGARNECANGRASKLGQNEHRRILSRNSAEGVGQAARDVERATDEADTTDKFRAGVAVARLGLGRFKRPLFSAAVWLTRGLHLMAASEPCPVCKNREGGACQRWPSSDRDSETITCDVCGEFEVSRSALIPLDYEYSDYTQTVRLAISSRIRRANDEGIIPPILTTYALDELLGSDPVLPTPVEQSTNIVRYVGDRVLKEFSPVKQIPVSFPASIGAPSRAFAMAIAKELIGKGLMTGLNAASQAAPNEVFNLNLTLDGWDLYEAEKRGKVAGNYGFIALKFGDPILDPFLQATIKPAIKQLGYNLIDLRDVARAGVIDNLLRAQIRDAAFVLVDLTHDNPGAYWEAGYAEGLGKPVLYLCEKTKFEAARTHFDTNHSTTVIWTTDAPDAFCRELVATLRRSLDLF